jgi:hypothetical protein
VKVNATSMQSLLVAVFLCLSLNPVYKLQAASS